MKFVLRKINGFCRLNVALKTSVLTDEIFVSTMNRLVLMVCSVKSCFSCMFSEKHSCS